jgi:hypothetical protein
VANIQRAIKRSRKHHVLLFLAEQNARGKVCKKGDVQQHPQFGAKERVLR